MRRGPGIGANVDMALSSPCPKTGMNPCGALKKSLLDELDRFNGKSIDRAKLQRSKRKEKFPPGIVRTINANAYRECLITCARNTEFHCTGLHVAIRVGVDDAAPTHPTMRVTCRVQIVPSFQNISFLLRKI